MEHHVLFFYLNYSCQVTDMVLRSEAASLVCCLLYMFSFYTSAFLKIILKNMYACIIAKMNVSMYPIQPAHFFFHAVKKIKCHSLKCEY